MSAEGSRPSRRVKLLSILALVAMASAGCGTTVPLSQMSGRQNEPGGMASGPTQGTQAGGSSLGPSTPGSGPAGSPGAAPAGATPGGSAGGVVTGSNESQVNAPTGPVGSVATSTSSRGPIAIGALTDEGAGAFQKSLGFSAGATGDQNAMTQSIVDYINANGGLGGRKIQLVSYDMNATAVEANPTAAWQAACTYFTQDHKVVAVASYLALAPDNFYQCLAQAHLPLVTPDEGVSNQFFQRFPSTVYMPSEPTYTRLLADSVDALWNAGWLTAKSTVGVVGYDTSDAEAVVTDGLVPALQRHGLKLAAELYTDTTTQAASEYNGGVLSFKTKNVDRVFFAPGGEPVYFALAAEQEAYHPYYELGSLEYPTVLAGDLPSDQLVGSMGLGWLPYMDLPSNMWSTITTSGIAECRRGMASANQDFSTGTTLGIAAWICDDWMLLRDVFNAGASPDAAGIQRAAESLGAAFKSAATFETTFAPGQLHDGASEYRLIAFQNACKCYGYASPLKPLQ